jgi:hypothetical protein
MHAAHFMRHLRRAAPVSATACAVGAVAGFAASSAADAEAANPFSRSAQHAALGAAVGSTGAAAAPARGWSWPDPSTFTFPAREKPVRLFDGDSFSGWSGKIGRYWTIENGAIKAIMSPYDAPPVSTYLISDSKHRNFRLLFEIRMPKGNHSGVGFWGHRHSFEGEDYTWRGHLAILPQTGIFDIYNRGWEARCKREGTTAGISGDWLEKGPGTGGETAVDGEAAADVYSLHGWNQVEILAVGNRIRIAINGVKTSDWTDPEPYHIREGPIALQQHWMNMGEEQIVLFRGLVIADDPEDYLITTK